MGWQVGNWVSARARSNVEGEEAATTVAWAEHERGTERERGVRAERAPTQQPPLHLRVAEKRSELGEA